MTWAQLLILIGSITTVVGGPLAFLLYNFKTFRDEVKEDVRNARAETATLERRIGHVERDFTSKEEWLREAALNRQQLDRIEHQLIRQNEARETESGLAIQLASLAESLREAVKQP